jgi:hypothetical protein
MKFEQSTVFEQLLNLYERSEAHSSIPLEDFTTEALSGVLKSDPLLLDGFVNRLLNQSGQNWNVLTQVYYPLENQIDCYVDMVFYNEKHLAFVENKVDSSLHTQQLERYEAVLLQLQEEQAFDTVSLHYCTKRIEEVSSSFSVPFHSFRWKDIYDYLKQYEKNALVHSFNVFLERKKLMKPMELESADLEILKQLPHLLYKLEGFLEPIRLEVEKRFGQVKTKEGKQSIDQVSVRQRYTVSIAPAFGSGYTDLTAGVHFENVPSLFIQVWCNRRNPKSELFLKTITKNKSFFHEVITKDKGWGARYEYPLSAIVKDTDQYQSIINWFVTHLDLIESFILETDDLDWNIRPARSIIACQGENRYLIQLGSGRGQVLDTFNGVLNPPQKRDSVLRTGDWEEQPLTQEEEQDILNKDVRIIKEYFTD